MYIAEANCRLIMNCIMIHDKPERVGEVFYGKWNACELTKSVLQSKDVFCFLVLLNFKLLVSTILVEGWVFNGLF